MPAALPLLCLLVLPQAAGDRAPRYELWYAPKAPIVSPRFEVTMSSDPASVDAQLAALRATYAERFARGVRAPFVARLRALGARVVYASVYAPAVVVEADGATLELLRALPELRYLGPETRFEAEQDSSRRTIRADAVARLALPVTGKGVKVCVLEASSVQTANPYVPAVSYFKSTTSVGFARHPTAVAGIIASQHKTYRGIAPGVALLNGNAGNFLTSTILAASDWAIKQGANTINASFGANSRGALRLMDHYFDHVVRHLSVNFIKGAGNTRSWVVTPGLGFNSITVGNSFDNKTPQWADDSMHSASGYLDPTTGHPKPEIVAPGTNLTGMLHTLPWVGAIGSGGSYAGPQGNAVAALIMERNPILKLWPEAIKATLMASAWHKIENALIGAKDGVGQLHAFAADAVVRRGASRLRYAKLTAASFGTGGYVEHKLPLDPWSETRAVVSWTSDPARTSPYTPNALKMDLDLVVFDPGMKQVAASSDAKRGFEIVRFVPQRGGVYTFRLVRKRFAGTTEPFALAVSQIHDTSVATLTGPVTLALGKPASFTLSDPYHAGRLYVALVSLSGGSWARAFPIQSRSVPLVADTITNLHLATGGGGIFTGYVGLLSGTGQAALGVAPPNLAWLVGLTLTQVGITIDTSSSLVLEVTPPLHGKVR